MFLFSLILFAISFASINSFNLGGFECNEEPAISAASLECSSEKCEVSCMQNYKFPNGEKKIELSCPNGRKWVARNYQQVPKCKPICSPACLNGGECYAPNQCMCQENFVGNRCQNRIATCSEAVPMPANTRGRCITSDVQSCKVTCVEGFKFPDNTLSADIKCQNGHWKMEPKKFDRCEPYCNPPCRNGGECLGPNVCQCTKDFRGNVCQFSTERCSPKKLNFNGLYKCTGSMDKMECTISCPEGFNFVNSQQPQPKYTCKYSDAFFTPGQVPKCDYRGMNVQITHA